MAKHIQTQSEKISKLETEIALIKKDINLIMHNHLHHLDMKITSINRILWTVGVAVFSNLIILVRDIMF